MADLCNRHPNCHVIYENRGDCPVCALKEKLEEERHGRENLEEDMNVLGADYDALKKEKDAFFNKIIELEKGIH